VKPPNIEELRAILVAWKPESRARAAVADSASPHDRGEAGVAAGLVETPAAQRRRQAPGAPTRKLH
jgi:hypothetical protein